MADSPEIKSREQIIAALIDGFLSRSQAVNDLRQGSVLLSLLEAFGEAGFRVSSDLIAMLDSISIDRATGDALKRIALDKKVPIYSATKATGLVDLYDDSFEKISDKVYAGRPAPVAGSAFIFVSDASLFPATGSIYIGRGTTAVEGPLSYGTTVRPDPDTLLPVSGVVPKSGGAYYMIVLDSGSETTKFHNLSESVVLAQGGDRLIPVGTTVQTSQATSAEAVSFTTTATAKILDGETSVTRVPIIASKDGTDSNAARGAIVQLLGVPFQGRAYNSLPLTNARPDDTDETLRERIKRAEQSRVKGTEAAIIQAAVDVTSPDELKRVTTANIKRTSGAEQSLVFDDGSGYEPIDAGIGLEQLLDQAMGGEKEFQLLNTMIERATVKSLNEAPFEVIGGDTLTIDIIGLGTYTHTFQSSDFKIYNQADSFEIVSSINSNYSLPFIARTVNNGKSVALTPKDKHNIQVTGGTANDGLGFPTNLIYTMRLYRNDRPVYQEGVEASVETLSQASWGNIVSGYTFKYSVDGTPIIDIAITDADFQVYGQAYVANTGTPIDIWVNVLNDKLAGVTASVSGDKIRLTSNSGPSDRASLKVYTDNTTYIGASMFGTNSVVESNGKSSDYTINTQTGQLEWAEAFDVGETATAGSKFTRARVETSSLTQTLSLGSNNLYFWAAIDGNADNVIHNISGASVTIAVNPVSYPTGTSKIQANSGAFDNALPGDYIICWKNAGESFLNQGNTGVFKILDVATNFLIVNNPNAVAQASAFALPSVNRFALVRSSEPVQVVEIDPTVVTSPNLLRDAINAQLVGATATVVSDVVRIQSNSADENTSEILIPAVTDNTAPLGLVVGKYSAVSSHAGFTQSDKQLGLGMPSFKLLTNNNASLQQTIYDPQYVLNDGGYNDLLQYLGWNSGYFLNNAGAITSYVYEGANTKAFEQVDTFNPLTDIVSPLRKGLSWRGTYNDSLNKFTLTGGYPVSENYTIRKGLGFDVRDNLSFIIDKDETIKAFIAPMARKVTVSSALPTPTQFDLDDAESSLDLNNPSTFRDFNFKSFKFWTKAKMATQGLSFLTADFGPSGSKQAIGFQYPTAPDSDTAHTVSSGPINTTSIILASGAEEPNDADSTTCWTVKKLATVGDTEFVEYTYRVGTAPNLAMTAGSVVNIAAGSSLLAANKGTFKITTNLSYPPTATTFTVERLKGSSVDDEVLNAVSTGIIYPFYNGIPFASGGTARVTTQTNHNLAAGDVVGLYNTDVSEYELTGVVTLTPTGTTFDVAILPSTGIAGGAVKNVRRVELSGLATWLIGTTYAVDDLVLYSGNYYLAIAPGVGNQPNISPAYWTQITGGDYITFYETSLNHNLSTGDTFKVTDIPALSASSFNGTFTVFESSSPVKFCHVHNIGTAGRGVSLTVATAGRVDQQPTVFGGIAKGLKYEGALTSYPISETQASVKTYVDTNLADFFMVTASTPANPVDETSDYYENLGPISVTISPIYGSKDRLVTLPSAPAFKKGAIITFTLSASGNPLRSDLHGIPVQVMDINGSTIRVRTSRYAVPSETPLTLGTSSWKATQTSIGFGSAESFVYTSDLSATPVSPAFTLKVGLNDIASGDEAYLIPTTAEQVSRLIGRLANSGLSNVSEVLASDVGYNLQITTNTYGSDGAVQMTGGKANSHGAAISGAGIITNGIGGFDIAKDSRSGIVPNTFIKAYNTSSQNKLLGIDSTTQLQITNYTTYAKITINGGAGTFQTQRAVTITNPGVAMKVEKHGKYACYSQVAGTALNLVANGVKEGDWVRIFDNTNVRFLSKNQGIFKIVRLYGDAFWVENEEAVEQYMTDLNVGSIKFYSYDSVMPGDKVTISTPLLGQTNTGTWTVDAWDNTNNWPSPTEIRISSPLANNSNVTLGTDYVFFNVIEKEPLSLIKQVLYAGPSVTDSDFAFIGVDSTELIDRVTSSFGGGILSLSKFDMDESAKLGLDAYRYYEGLIAELYKVIYGDPQDPTYPGVRAAGTVIDIEAPLIRRIQSTIDIRVKSGIPFGDIIDAVRSAAAGYVNTLGVGQPVSLSSMISTIQQVDGVVAVIIVSTNPVEDSGLIKVLPQEVAKVINPDSDITVNIVSG